MVNYVSAYGALVQNVRSSEKYRDANEKEREEIDTWLKSEEIRRSHRGLIPQLDLRESMVLAFANSEALSERTPEEQERVMKYLGGDFGKIFEDLERNLSGLFR